MCQFHEWQLTKSAQSVVSQGELVNCGWRPLLTVLNRQAESYIQNETTG